MNLEWTDWTGTEDVPINEWLIMEVEGMFKFQTGIFRLTADNNLLGTIGSRFHFDHKIIRWASIKEETETNQRVNLAAAAGDFIPSANSTTVATILA